MNINLTKSAINHINLFCKKNNVNADIRLGVKASGCSGMKYVIKLAKHLNKDDQIFTFQNIKIFINKHSMKYLENINLDYVKNNLKSGFVFNNPNVVNTCGCGESFNTK